MFPGRRGGLSLGSLSEIGWCCCSVWGGMARRMNTRPTGKVDSEIIQGVNKFRLVAALVIRSGIFGGSVQSERWHSRQSDLDCW